MGKSERPLILMDFDGVWTDVQGQARAVIQARVERLTALSGLPRQAVEGCLERTKYAMSQEPWLHGWRMSERITAYADEDPFLFHNGVISAAAQLGRRGDEGCAHLFARLLEAGYADPVALGSEIFMEASHAYLRDKGHDLIPHATELLHQLLTVADVVFCTNFATEAVASTWRRHGVVLEGPEAPCRLRGFARKQVLSTDAPRSIVVGGREVQVDRAFYEDVIRTEHPAMVVGDVLSMDLGLPLLLKRKEPAFAALRPVLVLNPHTPDWSRSAALSGEQGLEAVENLPSLIASL